MTPIDIYIANIQNKEERDSLENLRKIIHEILPSAEECISYGMPAFCVQGNCVAGFTKFKHHLSFFPFSGTTLTYFRDELDTLGFAYTKSGIHFTPEKPIPRELVEKIVQKRLEIIIK